MFLELLQGFTSRDSAYTGNSLGILLNTSREALLQPASLIWRSFDSATSTAFQRQCFADTTLLAVDLQFFHSSTQMRPSGGICDTIASCLAVTAQFSGSSLKLISVYRLLDLIRVTLMHLELANAVGQMSACLYTFCIFQLYSYVTWVCWLCDIYEVHYPLWTGGTNVIVLSFTGANRIVYMYSPSQFRILSL